VLAVGFWLLAFGWLWQVFNPFFCKARLRLFTAHYSLLTKKTPAKGSKKNSLDADCIFVIFAPLFCRKADNGFLLKRKRVFAYPSK